MRSFFSNTKENYNLLNRHYNMNIDISLQQKEENKE